MSSTFSAASEVSRSDLNEQECTPLPSARSIRSAAASSPTAGQASPAIQTSECSQAIASEQMELLPRSSVAGFPARTLAQPASVQDLRASILAYGRNTLDWLAKLDPRSSSWKTAQSCLVQGLETFSETWPRSGTMRDGIAYRRPSLVRPTAEIASGLLPTPRKSRGYTNPTLGTSYGAGCLTTEMLGRPVLGVRPLPQFVEWMMGFPIGWTELAPSEMPSSHKFQRSSAGQS